MTDIQAVAHRIEAFAREASQAGDHLMVAICRRALGTLVPWDEQRLLPTSARLSDEAAVSTAMAMSQDDALAKTLALMNEATAQLDT